jgi:hypothetical protein
MQIQNGKIETMKLSTLEVEGIALQRLYAKEQRQLRNGLKKTMTAEGLDYRLGKLIFQLRSENENGQISKKRLVDCNLHRIDRRRRSEAEWLFNNHSDVLDFINKNSKRGYTSLSALQRAMKPQKAVEATEGKSSEAKVSDVGQSESDTEGKTQETKSTRLPKTEEELCKAIKAICDKTNLDIQRVLEILLEEEVPSVVVKETTHTVPPIKIGKRVKGVWQEIPRVA